MTDRNLADLDPAFLPVAQQFLDRCNVAIAPSTVKAIVTWRDAADQNAAEECGLSKAGPGQSPHNCVDTNGNPAARALDFGVFAPDGSYVTNGTDSRYAQCGEIAEELGLTWGGSWTVATDGCKPDFDHIEPGRLEDRVTTVIRNVAALPVMLLAFALWALGEYLGRLSQLAGDGAAWIMGPENPT